MQTNSVVTIFSFNETLGEYIKLGSFNAWVYRQSRTRTDGDGTYSSDIFDVRIPSKIPRGIKSDDLICFENILSDNPPTENCYRIAAVTKNSALSCPHWHIEANNRYR